MPLTARATAGAQRCDIVNVTDGQSPTNKPAASPPRKPNTAWLGSPATRASSLPAASTRTRRAACGSSCWASSDQQHPNPSTLCGQQFRIDRERLQAAPTSSAAPNAGVVACGAAVPPPPAATSPARTAARIDPRPSIQIAGPGGPSAPAPSASTPRSAQRANRFRSSVAKPAVLNAGHRCVGHSSRHSAHPRGRPPAVPG